MTSLPIVGSVVAWNIDTTLQILGEFGIVIDVWDVSKIYRIYWSPKVFQNRGRLLELISFETFNTHCSMIEP